MFNKSIKIIKWRTNVAHIVILSNWSNVQHARNHSQIPPEAAVCTFLNESKCLELLKGAELN